MENLDPLDKSGPTVDLGDPQLVAIRVVQRVRPEAFQFRREIGVLLGRIRSGLSQDAASVIHITSATSGEGVSTVARELVYAAAAMPWCRPLLIDRNAGANDQGRWFGIDLPDLVGDYGSRSQLDVAAIEVGSAIFHVAKTLPNISLDETPEHVVGQLAHRSALFLAGERREEIGSSVALPAAAQPRAAANLAKPGAIMRLAYNLIVVDCASVLQSSPFVLLTQQPAETLLVVRAEHTRLSDIAEAKRELAFGGCEIVGVVLNKWRRRIPRLISRLM